jgi:hypothetical protein
VIPFHHQVNPSVEQQRPSALNPLRAIGSGQRGVIHHHANGDRT